MNEEKQPIVKIIEKAREAQQQQALRNKMTYAVQLEIPDWRDDERDSSETDQKGNKPEPA